MIDFAELIATTESGGASTRDALAALVIAQNAIDTTVVGILLQAADATDQPDADKATTEAFLAFRDDETRVYARMTMGYHEFGRGAYVKLFRTFARRLARVGACEPVWEIPDPPAPRQYPDIRRVRTAARVHHGAGNPRCPGSAGSGHPARERGQRACASP